MVHENQYIEAFLNANRVSGETPILAASADESPSSEEAMLPTEISPNPNVGQTQETCAPQETKPAPDGPTSQVADQGKPLWRVWVPEVASILLSISLTIAIVVVCSRYDRQSLPEWPLSVTLNSFVAFFSMGAKAAFIVPVSVAISQMQWDWFLRERPLYDFYVFDQASRGPWGSLILLKRVHRRHFVSLGAFLMVVSVVTSPVTQLIISYPLQNDPVVGEALVRSCRSIYESRDNGLTQLAKDGVYMATSQDTRNFDNPITAPVRTTCSIGNCTFSIYDSLGVCVATENITSHLQFEQGEDSTETGIPFYDGQGGKTLVPGSGKVSKAFLPGGLLLAHQNHFATIMESLNGNKTFGFQGRTSLLRTRIVSFTLIYTKPIFPRDPADLSSLEILQTDLGVQYEALEILFYLCVQSYRTTVQDGRESTELVSSVSKSVHEDDGPFLDLNCPSMLEDELATCRPNKARYNDTMYLEPPPTSKQPTETFAVNYLGLETLAYAMSHTLRLFVTFLVHPQKYPTGVQVAKGINFADRLFSNVLYSRESIANSTLREQRIRSVFESVAISLSSKLSYRLNDDEQNGAFNVTGQAWRRRSHVQINWGWISFLVVEIVLAATFLAFTITSQIIHQRRQKHQNTPRSYRDAKDSSLAYIVALGGSCREEIGGGCRPMGELEKLAKSFTVKLQGNELVLCQATEESESDTTVGFESQ